MQEIEWLGPRPMTMDQITENTFEGARKAVLAQASYGERFRIQFFVPTTPEGQARHGHRRTPGGEVRTHTKPQTISARKLIFDCWKEARPRDWRPWDGPVLLEVIDCHYAKSAYWGKHVRKKPDWDNSGKLVGDTLNQIAWTDDAIIISGLPQKCYWPWVGKWVRATFCQPVPEPKTGKNKIDDESWEVLMDGLVIGHLHRDGSRVRATRLDADLNPHKLVCDKHDSGNFRTVTGAEKALLHSCRLTWGVDVG